LGILISAVLRNSRYKSRTLQTGYLQLALIAER
jgi:hypothetical protein